MTALSIRRLGARRDPAVVVLLLHGGQQRNLKPVMRRHASWARIALMQNQLSGWAGREGYALWLLKYRARGWNATGSTVPAPVVDARETLRLIRVEHPEVPIVLVGHSMGGRTACRVADEAGVLGVVALAPWLPEGEPIDALAGEVLHVVHGTRDRWTSPRWSRDFVSRAEQIATEATWRSFDGVGHFMLRRWTLWNAFVRDSVDEIVRVDRSAGRDER